MKAEQLLSVSGELVIAEYQLKQVAKRIKAEIEILEEITRNIKALMGKCQNQKPK